MIQMEQEMMSRHTTFCVGGPAGFYLVPETAEEVSEAVCFAREKGLPYFFVGRGSNLLVSDEGYHGVVIEIGKCLSDIKIYDGGAVWAQAGVPLSKLAAAVAERGLAGFEFASGIPGTLGGGVVMNAGAYGGEIRDCICSAEILSGDGNVRVLGKDALELGYRTSAVQKNGGVVLSARFFFGRGGRDEIQAKMRELNQRRREKQPLEYPSAGSTFKRPEGYFAGKLIEDAGLRGYRVGGAQVSEKHCGFVVNTGGATASQIYKLIGDVQRTVYEKFQVHLEPEVKMLGEF